jgi:hypothetical protein
MTDITNAELDAAAAHGRALTEPRAASATYDRAHGQIVVSLTNGCSFTFPPRLAEGLDHATEYELAEVEVLGTGTGLHWESLDVDLSVPGLLAGLFGTKSHMARRAGQATSPAKAAAARANGARGGRPRKAS